LVQRIRILVVAFVDRFQNGDVPSYPADAVEANPSIVRENGFSGPTLAGSGALPHAGLYVTSGSALLGRIRRLRRPMIQTPKTTHPTLRRLELADMDAAARVLRTAFDQALPWLAGLHTPEEDRWFFRERVFKTCEVWGAFDGAGLIGVLAFRDRWIDQLYVLPNAQGSGVGSALLQIAQSSCESLHLWTFQRNIQARRFYEVRGFGLVEETDGARNEEKEPDAHYLWTR
jgi:GNAT superfamily N-acetyltransferase